VIFPYVAQYQRYVIVDIYLDYQGQTEPPDCLALAWWASWSGVQVGRRVKF